MAHKAIDLACGQLALTSGEIAEVPCGCLTEALIIDFLYGFTSDWGPSHNPASWLNYTNDPARFWHFAMSDLVEGAARLEIPLSAAQLAQLDQLGAALREGNRRVNLTRITEPADIETRHFLDSLTAAMPLLDQLRAHAPLRLVDVGSGGGMPGLPLKIAFPHLRVTLVESIGKKAAFLRATVQALGLRDVEVVAERAETVAREPEHRDAYDWATARAVGSLPVVVELCAPFLAPGGLLVAQRSGDLDTQLTQAAPAFKALRLWSRVPIWLDLPGLGADGGRRGLIVGEKYAPTPALYPRRPGIPRKHPLGRPLGDL